MRNRMAILLALAAIVWCGSAAAQQNVKGTTKDDAGKPIANATVELVSASGQKFTATTNKQGEFSLAGVPEGKYDATLLLDGQKIDALAGYSVTAGGANTLAFDLAKDRRRAAQDAANQAEKVKGLNQMLQQAAAARKAGDYPKAVSIMREATQVDAGQYVLWVSLGQSYLGAKQYPEAIEALKKALALTPDRHQFHNLLGTAYLRLKKLDEAVGEFKTAAELNDKNPADPKHNDNAAMYWYNAGATLTMQGKPEEAIAAFDKAIAADPKKADAYYQKAVNLIAKATLGKDGKMSAPAGTEEAFLKYLELSPNGQYAEPAKEMLAMIGAKVETQYGTAKQGKK